jgi:hypothetical protein
MIPPETTTILDGMEGAKVKDPDSVFDGMRLKNGWKDSGLPWTYEINPAKMILPARQSEALMPGNKHD